ncbi:carbohydrate-binding protein SusD [Wenyingzhuangia fucanilytica]|uniref:Carbohydrate-binding protein SusD n=1 Tax=Wenyingzhuangia fucanilytica TaxID=1790137 RepID=A0A1B1Y2V6_9FLAO|nr:RagB/SusD family nutrient uptake outer membrane protein [Wenyingzhuangia fucanilytica]ANW95067.1 carbohydrate-binding protein SusD [Wenyingzhuangia fucanilytica]
MKYIKNIILLTSTLLFVGCDESSFLEEINPNATTSAIFWETESQFNTGLTTVYGALQFQSVSGSGMQYEMVRADIAGTESWYAPNTFRNLTYTDGTFYVTDKWNELYIGIFRANQVIENINKVDGSSFTGNAKKEIEAQARFLRAYFYFELANTYGGAVIQTKIAETTDDLKQPFSTIAEVNTNVIIPDLMFAKENLPLEWTSDSDLGRATQGAAKSLLGKVYLYDQEWGMAATQFKEVIDSQVYTLVPDILDNYTDLNEFNSESIFEVSFSTAVAPGVNGAIVDNSPSENGAEASALARPLGQLNFGGYNTVLPSYFLHELFVNDEIDPSNPVNDGNSQSKRMGGSIVPIDGDGTYYNLPIGDKAGWSFGQSSYVKKYTNWYNSDSEDVNSRSGINFRAIRLADVYLMYAEAVLMDTGDFNTAITYIDKVRSRAGVKTLAQYMSDNAGQFPQLHVSKQVHGSQPLVTPSVQTVLTHIQRVERPLELCFEGQRWKDLVRWGIVQQVFTELRADEVWRQNNLDLTGQGEAPIFINERIRPDFIIASSIYDSAQHDYFPIPTLEVQANDNVK